MMEVIQVETDDESEEFLLADVVVKEEYSVEKSSSPEYKELVKWEQDHQGNKTDIKPEKKQKQIKKRAVGMRCTRRKFRCSMCENRYTSHYALRAHLEKMHRETTEMSVQSLPTQGRPSKTIKLVPSPPIQSEPNKVKIIPIKNRLLKPNNSPQKRTAVQYSPQVLYECGICYEKFSNEIETHDHILENHVTSLVDDDTNKVEYICPFCDKSFARRVLISAHLLEKHIDKKPIACIYCGTKFKSHDELSKHFSVCLKLFHCEDCQRSFNSKPGLAAHSQIHKKHKKNRKSTEDSNDTPSATEISVEPIKIQEEPQISLIKEIEQSESEQPKRVVKVYFVECRMESYLEDMKKKLDKN